MRLYGIVSPRFGWGDDPQKSNTTWSQEDVKVASHLEMVYGGKLDDPTAIALAGKTQRVKYKNFGGTAPLEAPSTEMAHHADIAYFRAGVLGEALTATKLSDVRCDGKSTCIYQRLDRNERVMCPCHLARNHHSDAELG